MKNVDEVYEKYYNAYENEYENDYELNEAKKKLFHKTDKKSKLDEETKKDLRRLKIEKKVLIKRGF